MGGNLENNIIHECKKERQLTHVTKNVDMGNTTLRDNWFKTLGRHCARKECTYQWLDNHLQNVHHEKSAKGKSIGVHLYFAAELTWNKLFLRKESGLDHLSERKNRPSLMINVTKGVLTPFWKARLCVPYNLIHVNARTNTSAEIKAIRVARISVRRC